MGSKRVFCRSLSPLLQQPHYHIDRLDLPLKLEMTTPQL
jgi:hypothetical protein